MHLLASCQFVYSLCHWGHPTRGSEEVCVRVTRPLSSLNLLAAGGKVAFADVAEREC